MAIQGGWVDNIWRVLSVVSACACVCVCSTVDDRPIVLPAYCCGLINITVPAYIGDHTEQKLFCTVFSHLPFQQCFCSSFRHFSLYFIFIFFYLSGSLCGDILKAKSLTKHQLQMHAGKHGMAACYNFLFLYAKSHIRLQDTMTFEHDRHQYQSKMNNVDAKQINKKTNKQTNGNPSNPVAVLIIK